MKIQVLFGSFGSKQMSNNALKDGWKEDFGSAILEMTSNLNCH
jgi:hypothetical protein